MTLVLLNNVDHHDLRVRTPAGAHGGAEAIQVLAFAPEFEDLQRQYPIVFRASTEGPIRPTAILGLAEKENLFVDETGGWRAGAYIPAAIQRGPFALARFEDDDVAPQILIETDHPSVSQTEGEALFLARGGTSRFLDRIIEVLETIHQGEAQADALIAAFERADILQSANLQVRTGEDEVYAISGVLVVARERLERLSDAALLDLNRAGFLAHAIYAASSLGNLQRLADLKARSGRPRGS